MAMHGRERREPRREHPVQRRGSRKLVIRGEVWFWRFGHTLDIRDSKGNGHKAELTDVLGRDWDEIERASWKRSLAVDPCQIVDHINRRILGYDDAVGFPKGSPWRRHQAEIRRGWVSFEGPRGAWQAKLSPWIVDLRSPEDVGSQARLNEILGLTTDQWIDIKVADLAAEGLTVDDLWRIEQAKPHDQRQERIQVLLNYPAPSVPTPTMKQLGDYAMRHVVGAGARALR